MRSLSFVAVFLIAFAQVTCRRIHPISGSIAAAVAFGPGTRLVLGEHAGFPWEKVCIFGPYSPDGKVDTVTGVRGAASRAFDIRSNDGINVVMFIHEGAVVTSVAHPRNQGDFGPEIAGNCYSRDRSQFIIRIPPTDGWGNIGPS